VPAPRRVRNIIPPAFDGSAQRRRLASLPPSVVDIARAVWNKTASSNLEFGYVAAEFRKAFGSQLSAIGKNTWMKAPRAEGR
jgi:hypothetical protein